MSSNGDEVSTEPLQQSSNQQRSAKAKGRTPRACDQCRLKKAKCDGRIKCRTCKTSSRTCTYTTRRGREARNYYSRIRDINEEALQTLYAACRKAGNFPGSLPMEDEDGFVTTNAILEGLGLIESTVDEQGMPRTLMAKSTNAQKGLDLTQAGNHDNRSFPGWTTYVGIPHGHTRSSTSGDYNAYVSDPSPGLAEISSSSNEYMRWHNQPMYGMALHPESFNTTPTLNNATGISTGFDLCISEPPGSLLDPASLYDMSGL